MNLESRSFSGETFRPTPVVESFGKMLFVATPWNTGEKKSKKLIHSLRNHYLHFAEDLDRTKPFESMRSLSLHENNTRMACMQANTEFFSSHNKKELTMGFELFFAVQTKSECIFASVGHPQIYIAQKDRSLQPLCQSSPFFLAAESLAPLPFNLFGIFPDVSVSIQSIKIQKSIQVILLSRSNVSSQFLTCQDTSLESLGKALAQDQSSEPFWLGKIIF